MPAMKMWRKMKPLTIGVCFSLLAGGGVIPPMKQAAAAPADFFSSFEKGDPQPTWENTVETDASGKKMASGVDGNIPFDGIQGDITDKVTEITVPGENPPDETKDKLIDRDVNTKWLIKENSAYIQLKLSEAEAVIKIALTSANDFEGRDPRDWTFSGSNDGEHWTTLDKKTNEVFKDRFQTKIYEFENKEKYLYYRLDITKNGGEPMIQLAEIQLSNGIDVPPPPPSDMKSEIGNGPSSAYMAKTKVGWTGLRALTYSGTHTSKGRAYSYNKVFDVEIPVTSKTELSYYIFPEFTNRDHLDDASTYMAVDLAFSDGTYLHDLGAVDQHGIKLHPREQGKSKTLYSNQWNHKKSKIGAVAAGKTIKRILIAYDHPKGPAVFKGSIDDIKIEGNPTPKTYSKPSEYVNTLRGTQSNGTFSRGNNFPAVAVPHGFNFWTPVTDAGSTSWLYHYHERNNGDNLPQIEAFSVSHETSPWMGDRQTFQVMPSADKGATPTANRKDRALPFRHSNEVAQAHYYSVRFDNGIQTEMTPTDHAAMVRFTFKGDTSNLIFDNVNNNGGITLDQKKGELSGYSDVKSGLSTGATRMFFYATFDQPVTSGGKLTGEGRDHVTGYFRFDTGKESDKVVTMKIATSLISVDQAKKNLEQEIGSKDTFESIKEKAQKKWDEKLGKIEVEGATEDQLVTLYSNMYRLFLYPNSGFENVGTVEQPEYKYASPFSPAEGADTPTQTGAKIVAGKPYVNNGFWDTYRATWPAYTLLTPTMAGEMIDGFVQHYRDGGWISRWSSPGYANLMVGTSSDVAFADAYLKGVTNFDVESFYQSAVKNSAVISPNAGTGRKGLDTSIFDGYTNTSTGEGLSWAMDGYINDFGIANLAHALDIKRDKKDPYHSHYKEDYPYYLNRAQNYIHLFNPDVKFFMGRKSDGSWRATPDQFNPAEWGGDYTETNAWNMAFHAPQDGQGLANLYGGREKLAEKLDKFFSTPETASPAYKGAYGDVIHEMREARDVRMGMYGHSNQPSHHIAYMYNYAGQPWKTQEKVREVLDRLYIGSEIGQGYPGDEDNGEMSAWYIFSALGFYPLQMGSPEYVIGSPLFKKATIHLENGKKIVINAPENSKENRYVQSLKINGKKYTHTSLSHEILGKGAVLDFEMGPKPSKWGSKEQDLPKSITPGSTDGSALAPQPMKDLTDGLNAGEKGIATDSEGGHTDLLFDNTSGTRLTMESKTPWIQYRFKEGKQKAQMYTLTSGTTTGADPRSWVLKGSNDGKKWTILDRRSDERFRWRQYTRAFTIQHPGKYSFYRLEVTSNGGHATTSLAEMELLGFHDIQTNFDTMEKSIQGFAKSGEMSRRMKARLLHRLHQARDQYEKEHLGQAVTQMQKFLKDIDHSVPRIHLSTKAKKQLTADAHATIHSLSR